MRTVKSMRNMIVLPGEPTHEDNKSMRNMIVLPGEPAHEDNKVYEEDDSSDDTECSQGLTSVDEP